MTQFVIQYELFIKRVQERVIKRAFILHENECHIAFITRRNIQTENVSSQYFLQTAHKFLRFGVRDVVHVT